MNCRHYHLRLHLGLIVSESGPPYGKGDMCHQEATKELRVAGNRGIFGKKFIETFHLCEGCYNAYKGWDTKMIDHSFTNEIVCPHCGYEFIESYEFFGSDEDSEIECGECEKVFIASRYVDISYSTHKIEKSHEKIS